MATTQDVLQLKTEAFVDRDVPRVSETEALASVIDKVTKHPDHIAFVVDRDQRLKGVVSDHDLVTKMKDPTFAQRAATMTAADVMTPLDPATANSVAFAADPLLKVIPSMKTYKSIPVVDSSGTVVGQVTRASISENLDRLLG